MMDHLNRVTPRDYGMTTINTKNTNVMDVYLRQGDTKLLRIVIRVQDSQF